MKKLLIFAFTVLSVFLSLGHTVSAQVNISFETGTNPGSFTTVYASQTNITNWSVDFGSVDYIGTYWQPSTGVRSIDLNGQNQRGQISQIIPTTTGWTYKVTFDLSGNPDGGPTVKFMSVSADKEQTQFYFYIIGNNTRVDMQWEPNTYHFTANFPITFLSFTSQITGFYGPALDNINVSVETQVCHQLEKTLTLSPPEVAVHLAHGDTPGPCAEK